MYEADRLLVARMCAGDQRAFDAFFKDVAPRVAAYAARRSGLDRASVEDIVQNTLIKAVRALPNYRGEAALRTWVTEICRRELADVYRKAARRPGHDSVDGPGRGEAYGVPQLRGPADCEPPAEVEADLRRRAIARVMSTIPLRYAEVLEAKYGEELSVEEIAASLQLTAVATQSLLARAREAFRRAWESMDASGVEAAPTVSTVD